MNGAQAGSRDWLCCSEMVSPACILVGALSDRTMAWLAYKAANMQDLPAFQGYFEVMYLIFYLLKRYALAVTRGMAWFAKASVMPGASGKVDMQLEA